MPKGWMYLAAAIVAEVIGTTSLKASDGFTKPLAAAVVVAGYAVSFYFLAQALRHVEVGVAYAVWAGVGIVLITMLGVALFRERLDLAAYVGIALIIAGVLVLSLLSNTAGRS